jgi:hypothetical protein
MPVWIAAQISLADPRTLRRGVEHASIRIKPRKASE